MKRVIMKMLAVVAGISFITGLLFWVICAQATDLSFYTKAWLGFCYLFVLKKLENVLSNIFKLV